MLAGVPRFRHAIPCQSRSAGFRAHHLPDHAQDIYREAFNHAYAAHAGEADGERRSHMIAWAAVKRGYVKQGDQWVPHKATAL
ncbi:MAG: ChaB family protein [Pseudolabrys sp.]